MKGLLLWIVKSFKKYDSTLLLTATKSPLQWWVMPLYKFTLTCGINSLIPMHSSWIKLSLIDSFGDPRSPSAHPLIGPSVVQSGCPRNIPPLVLVQVRQFHYYDGSTHPTVPVRVSPCHLQTHLVCLKPIFLSKKIPKNLCLHQWGVWYTMGTSIRSHMTKQLLDTPWMALLQGLPMCLRRIFGYHFFTICIDTMIREHQGMNSPLKKIE